MGYFPLFIELEGASALVVGGGLVALRKVEKLLPYGPKITIVSPKLLPELEQNPKLVLHHRPFVSTDLDGHTLVIAATNDQALNHQISQLCQQRHIPVNVVDDKQASTFLFPSLIQRGGLSVGISTSGESPSAAIYLKEQFSSMIPENFGEILSFLAQQRPMAQQTFSQLHQREQLMKLLFYACLDKKAPLTPEETLSYVQAIEEETA